MQIKQNILAHQVQKNIAPLYILVGQDNYLLNNSLATIKSALKKNHHFDETQISIQNPEDWNILRKEMNSYSLFSNTILLNVSFDKKIIDAAGKKILIDYLNSRNTHCFIIIKAPNISGKQSQWLSSHHLAVVTVIYPLNTSEIIKWITAELKKNELHFNPEIPHLIHQYTQGNMLACAQMIEKIVLTYDPKTFIDLEEAHKHLSNQCEYNLFELVDACLLGEANRAIQILRHVAHNKTEAPLILWLLTQEIRLIMQISYLVEQQDDIKKACAQLKVWPYRIYLYQVCHTRFITNCSSLASGTKELSLQLKELHRYCYFVDEQIKSSNNGKLIWNFLEHIALTLCFGKNKLLSGFTCNV